MVKAMVMAIRVPVNKEGKGGMGHGIGNKKGDGNGGMSDGNKGGGRAMAQGQWQRRRQTTINQQQDQQRQVVAGKRALMRQPHDYDGGRQQTTRACGG